jgi:hypothetical protein
MSEERRRLLWDDPDAWPMESIERVTKVLREEWPDRVPVGRHCYLLACEMHGGRFDEILRSGVAREDGHEACQKDHQ